MDKGFEKRNRIKERKLNLKISFCLMRKLKQNPDILSADVLVRQITKTFMLSEVSFAPEKKSFFQLQSNQLDNQQNQERTQ